MKRFFAHLFLVGFGLYFIIDPIAVSEATTKKRIAVLYFEDHSRFDSATGCGFIPSFIANMISTQKRWDLGEGFPKILNRRLVETDVYEPVSEDELLDAMAFMTLSRPTLKKMDQEQRATLAKRLNADVIVMGDIRRFNQERLRTNASRTLREGGRQSQRGSASYMAPVILRGSLHRATIRLDMKFYNAAGNVVTETRINATRDHSYAGTKFASLEASVTEEGTNLTFGQTPAARRKNPRPIVKPTELNKIEFATTQQDVTEKHPHHYNETLLGMVTNEALIKVVLALRDSVGPKFITPWETQPATSAGKPKASKKATDSMIEGKIQHVDNEDMNNIYVNIGSNEGIAVNQRFAVYGKGAPIRDTDTGEILTYLPRRIATIVVADIRTDKFSIFRVVKATDTLKRGDVVREITDDEVDASAQSSSEADAAEEEK